MPTQLIFTDNPGGLPARYTLPAGLDLRVSSIVARIDGAGAAGTFRPALAIYSQDGKLMARVAVTTDFAVGDAGVVTWAPFLRRAAIAASAGAGGEYARLRRGNTLTMVSGTEYNVFFDGGAVNTGFASDSGVLDISTADGWIVPTSPGVFLAALTLEWSVSIGAAKVAIIVWSFGGAPVGIPDRTITQLDYGHDEVTNVGVGVTTLGDGSETIAGRGAQTTGVNRTLNQALLQVVRVSADEG